MNKIFISFFFKKPKPKKSVKAVPTSDFPTDDSDVDEIILDNGNEDEEEDPAILEEAVEEAQAAEEDADDGQAAHDNAVVKSLRDKAILQMHNNHQISMSSEEERMALKLFPAVYP
jgi:hypothetical protein